MKIKQSDGEVDLELNDIIVVVKEVYNVVSDSSKNQVLIKFKHNNIEHYIRNKIQQNYEYPIIIEHNFEIPRTGNQWFPFVPKKLTNGQVEEIVLWLNQWDQLKDTDIPIRFKETFSKNGKSWNR